MTGLQAAPLFIIYKIINHINGKIYIGKHIAYSLNDDYMGSGKHITRAIKKYGIENFSKHILFMCTNEDEMNAKEAELVTEDFCNRIDTYNICPGGKGGWGYVNSLSETKESRKRGTIAMNLVLSKSEKISKKKSERMIEKWKDPSYRDFRLSLNTFSFAGHHHTVEVKQSIGKSNSISQSGERNSQFGSFWITDGISNKKCKKNIYEIPKGWYKGRTISVTGLTVPGGKSEGR